MVVPLTKTLDPADFALLEPEMRTVDQHFTAAREQHPMRRWEYAMALRAQNVWREANHRPRRVYDVGGAGSPFVHMVDCEDCLYDVAIIDPDHPDSSSLDRYVSAGTKLGDNVFCLSVLEHVDDLDQFLYHLSCLVAPGGLLFLTMDFCDESGLEAIDTYHFRWMRKRIFNANSWHAIGLALGPYSDTPQFELLGKADWIYNGPHVYDYTFASLALVKRS